MVDLRTTTAPLVGELPGITFKWDPETEILSGHFDPDPKGRGLTGAVEVAGEDGAMLVVDVQGGDVCGVEVVVWPELVPRPRIRPPDAAPGRVVVPARPSQPGIGAVEVEVAMRAEANEDESLIHFRFGKAVEAVQVADRLIVERDADGRIAGFFLLQVPSFPGAAPA